MRIELEIGTKVVDINSYASKGDEEGDYTWGQVLSELIFPALRGHGYIIEEEWVDALQDDHQQFVQDKVRDKHRK